MNWILKNKNKSVSTFLLSSLARKWKQIFVPLASFDNKKSKTLLVVLFLVFGGWFYFSNNVIAADLPSTTSTVNGSGFGGVGTAAPISGTGTGGLGTSSNTTGNTSGVNVDPNAFGGQGAQSSPYNNGKLGEMSGASGSSCKLDIECYFTMMLVGIFNLTAWLFSIAATIFAWVVEPANISGPSGMLNKPAVKDVWVMVRDILNMTFILILLFAAFCTIFQVEKWNLKKVWLNILINALLVNFSYPIARFFIDVSNVAFYYFVNNLFSATGTTQVTGSTIFASFGAASNLGSLITPGNYTEFDTAYIIAMIVVTFILGMTLLIIAGLFLVRLVALTMLVMFSPVGFVGYIFPSTHSYADKWWTQLFSYSFFAPIMIFIMAIALRITEAMGRENFNSFVSNANANSTIKDANWIANAAFFAIPIIILWMGMGVAKSFGVAGADTVVGLAKKGGKWLATRPWATAKYVSHATGVTGGAKLGWDNFKKKGLLGSAAIEERAARIGRGLGDKHAVNDVQSKRVKEASDHHDMANMTDPDLQNLNRTGNEFEKAAAVLELANRGKADARNVDAVKKQFGDNSRVFNQIRNKVKAYDPAAAFATSLDPNTGAVLTFDTQRMTEHLNSNQFDAKKVNSASLGNAEFVGLAMTTGNMTPADLADLAKKGKPYADNIKVSLKSVIDNSKTRDASGNVVLDRAGNELIGHQDMSNEIDRNIQMAYFSSSGKIHSSLEVDKQKAELVKRWDKDNAKKLSVAEIGLHADVIARNVNSGKLKEIVTALDNKSKKAFIDAIMNAAPPLSNETVVLQSQIRRDYYLRALI